MRVVAARQLLGELLDLLLRFRLRQNVEHARRLQFRGAAIVLRGLGRIVLRLICLARAK